MYFLYSFFKFYILFYKFFSLKLSCILFHNLKDQISLILEI